MAPVLAITALVCATQMLGRPAGTDDETQLIQLERSWNQAEMGGDTGATKGKPYTRRARFTDTWIKQNGQWKCVASQSTLIQ